MINNWNYQSSGEKIQNFTLFVVQKDRILFTEYKSFRVLTREATGHDIFMRVTPKESFGFQQFMTPARRPQASQWFYIK